MTDTPAAEPDRAAVLESRLRGLGMFHDRAIEALRGVVDDLPADHPQRPNIEHLIETADNQ